MKFLSKHNQSSILKSGIIYKTKKDNSLLRYALMEEQNNFCAYTEKYLEPLDSVEIEHFNPSLKDNDNYFNYYAVVRIANQYKKDSKYQNKAVQKEGFFNSLFFQNQTTLNGRIRFVEGFYEAINIDDTEAVELIDFLGLNDNRLYEHRRQHVKNLKVVLADKNEMALKNYFSENKKQLSFPTAIESEFKLDLSEIISSNI